MDLIDPHFTEILETLGDGFAFIQDEAMRLLQVMALLEISVAAMWWGFGNSNVVEELLKKVLKIGFFIFVVSFFTTLIPEFMSSLILAGSGAAGGPTSSTGLTIFSPDALIAQGLRIGFELIFDVIASMAGAFPDNIFFFPVILVLVVVNILLGSYIIFGYAAMAINVVIVTMEFYIVSVLSILIFPFGLFRYTAFLGGGEKSLQAIFQQGIKLMLLTTVITLCIPLFDVVATRAGDFDFSGLDGLVDSILIAFELAILVMLIKKLISAVPQLASAMMGQGGMGHESGDNIAQGAMGGIKQLSAAHNAVGGMAGKAVSGVGSAVNAARAAKNR